MRIALISDLHGNALALEAVLADADVDRVICLGDVATLGPRPVEVLELLAHRQIPCIMGNHDAFLIEPELLQTYTEAPPVVAAVDWCRTRLGPDHLDFVRTFQATMELSLPGGRTLFLFHGSPESHMQDLLATTPAEELDHHLRDAPGDVLAGGHTHIQMMRQHRGRWLVNPGSVGLPFLEYVAGAQPTILPHAEYAIVSATERSVQVELRKVDLEPSALRAQLAGLAHPLEGGLLQAYADPLGA